MVTLRRFFVLAALFFWQGGFTFYASVVVPVGQEQLGHRRQGFVTRNVTWYLNLSGAVALIPLLWDNLASCDPVRLRRRARGLCWLMMLLTLVTLFWEHRWLDELLLPKGGTVLDPEEFEPRHRVYLWTNTVQWAAALGYMVLMLRAWRVEDMRLDTDILVEDGARKNAVPARAAR
jgi:hypothetical protein